jgi:hypothetical protein
MKGELALRRGRYQQRLLIRAGVLSVVMSIVFFVAPVIPVRGSYHLPYSSYTSLVQKYCGPDFLYRYTVWESLGYYAFKFGFYLFEQDTQC